MRAFHKSIRWRLQAWHALVLLAVLAVFGVTAYGLVQENHFKRIDAQLQRRMTVVVASIGPRPRAATAGLRPAIGFRLPPEEQALFDGKGLESYYYVLWLSGGEVKHASVKAPPDVPMPDLKGTSSDATLRVRGGYRELAAIAPRLGPLGPRVAIDDSPRGIAVVGCSVESTQAELRHLAWWFAVVGGCVWAFGLATGWLLSARVIKPIGAISMTAKTIANGNLSLRIDLADTESELGELARVLNETFDRLQSTMARQAQFTADASHELRTPTFVILSQAQSALRRERTVTEYREGFEICRRAAQQIRRLIESLLILVRQDAGEGAARREPCALDEIAAEGVNLLRPLASDRNVTLRLDLGSAPVLGDAQQLHQVVTNLVMNAIEYNRPGGEVKVAVSQENGSAVLTVSDNGPGIAGEDLPHVFERFYRADKSRTSAEGHTGLGLAICKAIVEAHGGWVEVSSAPGEGATFTIRLPEETDRAARPETA